MNRIAKIPFALPLFLNRLVKKTNWYRNVIPDESNYPDNEWYRSHLERNYDVVNVGSSSAVFAFDYTGLNVKAFNWAMQPQSLEYSFKILKMYFSILAQKGIVLIPFSPFSGLSVAGKWPATANDKYYTILDSTLVDDYESVKRRRNYPLFTQPRTALKRLVKDVPRHVCGTRIKSCYTEEEFRQDAERWMEIWKKEFNIEYLSAPLSDENKKGAESRRKLLSEMIDFCLVRELRPVLVLPPMHPALSNLFTKEFKENYIYSFLRRTNTRNILFLDYFDDKRFVSAEDYDNSFFLSQEGARRFTRIVLEDVKRGTKD